MNLSRYNVTHEVSSWILAMETIHLFYLPALIIIGTLGNLCSIIVIFGSKLKDTPPNQYLASVSASDTTYLLGLLPIWLGKAQLLKANTDFWCTFVLFVMNTSSWLSSWSITALTIERFFVITQWSKKLADSSVARSRYIIILLLPLPVIFNLHVFYMTEAQGRYCSYVEAYMEHSFYINIADTIIVFALPLLLIVLSNLAVFLYLLRHKATLFGGDYTSRRHMSTRMVVRQRQQLAHILVVVPCVFLALNLPSYSLRLKHYFNIGYDDKITHMEIMISDLALLLYYTSYATNFIVYALASRNFRQAALRLCRGTQLTASEVQRSTARGSRMPSRSPTKEIQKKYSTEMVNYHRNSIRSSIGGEERRESIVYREAVPNNNGLRLSTVDERESCDRETAI